MNKRLAMMGAAAAALLGATERESRPTPAFQPLQPKVRRYRKTAVERVRTPFRHLDAPRPTMRQRPGKKTVW
jgi:hypothetical protein